MNLEAAIKNLPLNVIEHFVLIKNISELNLYLEECLQSGILAVNVVTNKTNGIIGVSFYNGEQPAAYIPINHVDYISGKPFDNQFTETDLTVIFDSLKSFSEPLIMIDAIPAIRALRHYANSYIKCYWDVAIAAKLLNENLSDYSLTELYIIVNQKTFEKATIRQSSIRPIPSCFHFPDTVY